MRKVELDLHIIIDRVTTTMIAPRLIKTWLRLFPVMNSRRDFLDDSIKIEIFRIHVTGRRSG